MADVRGMFDRKHLGAWDLQGRDWVLKIQKVTAEALRSETGKKQKKPVVSFEGAEKTLVLNKTIAKVLIGLYGPETSTWVGRLVTLYPTRTMFGNAEVDCIRVRPTVPKGKADPHLDAQPIDEAMRAEQEAAVRGVEAEEGEARS